MALRSYSYKPYKRRRNRRRNRKVRFFFFLLIIIIAAVVIFKSCGKEDASELPVDVENSTPVHVPTETRNVINMPGQNKKPAETKKEPEPVKAETKKEEIAKVEIPAQPETVQQTPATIEELKAIEEQAKELVKDKKIIEARDLLNKTLQMPLTAKQRNELKSTLESFSQIWLFSDKVLPNDTLTTIHKVRPGQVPAIIGREYNVPWQFLLKINNIDDPKRLWAGAKIKVVKGPFSAKIYRSTFTMDVYLQGTYVKSYKVGLGKLGAEGNPTPTGLWRVKERGMGKLKRPPWPDPVTGKLIYYEDPEYPLGERWIGLDGIDGDAKGRTGFGIHGTNEPASIGKFASDGCIRMLNEQVLEFYDMVTEGMTEIQVVD